MPCNFPASGTQPLWPGTSCAHTPPVQLTGTLSTSVENHFSCDQPGANANAKWPYNDPSDCKSHSVQIYMLKLTTHAEHYGVVSEWLRWLTDWLTDWLTEERDMLEDPPIAEGCKITQILWDSSRNPHQTFRPSVHQKVYHGSCLPASLLRVPALHCRHHSRRSHVPSHLTAEFSELFSLSVQQLHGIIGSWNYQDICVQNHPDSMRLSFNNRKTSEILKPRAPRHLLLPSDPRNPTLA